MYRGATHLNLDEKGRISMPARYREEILATCGGRLVTTVDLSRCLMIYPYPEWERIEAKLMAQPNMNRKVRNLQRLLIGYASECEMSAQGRVLIGPSLRKFAGLEKQVMLVGQGHKFELWNADRWEKLTEQWLDEVEDEDLEDSNEALKSLSL